MNDISFKLIRSLFKICHASFSKKTVIKEDSAMVYCSYVKSFKEISLPYWSVVVSPTYWLADYQFIWNTREFCSLFDRNYKKIWRLSLWIIKNSCKNTSKYLKSAYLWIFVGERIRTLHTYRVGMPPTTPSAFPHFRGAVEENCANLFFFFIVPFSKYTRKLWIKETNTHKTVNRWEEAPRQGQTNCACVLDFYVQRC